VCPNKAYTTPFAQDGSKAKSAYNINGVANMQADIQAKGTITVSFDVYADFLTYKSGVYTHVSGALLGGHSVRIIGWGTATQGGDYWLVANSWNQYWGNGGTFKIARGVDECGIEDAACAGDA